MILQRSTTWIWGAVNIASMQAASWGISDDVLVHTFILDLTSVILNSCFQWVIVLKCGLC